MARLIRVPIFGPPTVQTVSDAIDHARQLGAGPKSKVRLIDDGKMTFPQLEVEKEKQRQ